jgi:serine/threonine protein phosphatase 1
MIYAIGDVHGRSDLLSQAIQFIEQHSLCAKIEPRVFFLGDIVDRGPDSRGAMDIVVNTLKRWPNSRLILGNHDKMFPRCYDQIREPGNCPGMA